MSRTPISRLARLAVAAAWCLLIPAAVGAELAEQRRQYVEARQALQSGRLTEFRALAAGLRSYPLYPYLVYDYIRPRLKTLSEDEIAGSLALHDDVPGAADVRSAWLRVLAQRRDWNAFLRHYRPQTDIGLRCLQLAARLNTGNTDFLLEDARTLWLHPKSQPKECDPVFERLAASELMTTSLVWDRIRLAMDAGEAGLADWLGRRLPAPDRALLDRWLLLHRDPWRGTALAGDGSELWHTMLLHGMRRLARSDVNRAIERWSGLRDSSGFTREQVAELDRTLALAAARARHPRAAELLDRIDNELVDEEVFDWRVRTALREYDWPRLLHWTEGEAPAVEPVRQSFLYWRARALEQTGQAAAAADLLRALVTGRDYYAFMAADRLAVPYQMNHRPLPHDPEAVARIEAVPAIQRARELYLLGSQWQATREWQHTVGAMTSYDMQIAAAIAARWGWVDRAIFTLGAAEAWDDLVLRFPVAWESELRGYAGRRDLDLGWLFALVRAESAFREDARSPAGALGLMQVMPATGRETAGRIGMKHFSTGALLNAESNIPIGTAYMRQMLDYFGGNLVLATAAYNAGPGNVSRWLPAGECVEPDVWIERIPITETRKYVQRILYYASIYDWRLERDITPVAGRIAGIASRPRELVAVARECGAPDAGSAVSMN
jgi:soluble lytic murein transglycosylase